MPPEFAATPEEKPRLWKIMRDIFPQYDTYQAQAGREKLAELRAENSNLKTGMDELKSRIEKLEAAQ